MKLLYCHDNVYFHSELGEVYSQGQFPYSYFIPFIEAFGEIVVAGRGVPLNKSLDTRKLNLSSGPGLDFALMPNINSLGGLARNYKRVNAELERLVAQADAVIIRAVSDLGWLVYRHARAMNKPIAMEMAACAWDSTWNHGSPYSKIYAPVRYWRDRTITRHADFVLYVTQNFLQGRYRTPGFTAVASNVRIPEPDPATLARRLAAIEKSGPGQIAVIGLIGTLGHKLKGVHTALHALRRLEDRNPGGHVLRILGPGNPDKFREMARRLGLSHIVFFDGVIQSGTEVLKWLEGIDIYIQPSFQEGVPRATIEAMSAACAAVGSTAGGIPELLPPDWLHKPGDDARLAHLIEKLSQDKTLRREAAARNFEKARFYTESRLMPVRNAFWKSFAEFAHHRAQAGTPSEIPALPDASPMREAG